MAAPAFYYFECPACEFSSIQSAEFKGSAFCPICAGDNGRDVSMHIRPAEPGDKPEGHDARAIHERLHAPAAPQALGTDDWHKQGLGAKMPDRPPLRMKPQPEFVPPDSPQMTGAELKAAMEAQWLRPMTNSMTAHKPAGWVDPASQETVAKGGFWKLDGETLWPRKHSRPPSNSAYRRRRRRR